MCWWLLRQGRPLMMQWSVHLKALEAMCGSSLTTRGLPPLADGRCPTLCFFLPSYLHVPFTACLHITHRRQPVGIPPSTSCSPHLPPLLPLLRDNSTSRCTSRGLRLSVLPPPLLLFNLLFIPQTPVRLNDLRVFPWH
ncbi:unnamed protein product [Musa acuminata var. zebrina]